MKSAPAADHPITLSQTDHPRIERDRIVTVRRKHPFSMDYPTRFQIGGQWFGSAEQCFMYYQLLALGHGQAAIQITNTDDRDRHNLLMRDAMTATSGTRDHHPVDAIGMARSACWHKLHQNPGIWDQLAETGTDTIVYVDNDPVWGSGPYVTETDVLLGHSFMGENQMGKILMNLRRELRRGLGHNTPPYVLETLPGWWAQFSEEIVELFPPGTPTT